MDKNATGRFIAELRKQKGFTQKELAEKLMVTDKAISRWETGKGLPDTSLLKPLGEALDVSISELLSGKIIEEAEMKEQTDKIIFEALIYSKRMLASTICAILFIIGIAFIISPLFWASQSSVWALGIILIVGTTLYIYIRKLGYSMKATDKVYFLAALALTGILTILIILLGVIALFKFDKATSIRKVMFVCSVVSLMLSIVPLFLFGTVGMTAASYVISCVILLSLCLQAVANRQE